MIKATAQLDDGNTLIILGITPYHVKKTEDEKLPLIVPLRDLGLPDHYVVVIVHDDKEERQRQGAVIQERFTVKRKRKVMVLAMDHKEAEALRQGLSLNCPNFNKAELLLYLGDSEAAMQKELKDGGFL